MARLAGLEPTASASAGLRSIQLSYKRFLYLVPRGRVELPRPYGHYALNVARLPFRHLGPTLYCNNKGAAFQDLNVEVR
jgi:hypothetical protein